MPHFVYDGTTLPNGKSNARPLTGSAAQSVTAAEWNTSMQAIADLREALISGKYWGLVSDPTATVSASGAAKLRNKGGHLEVSLNGGTYHRVEAPIRPEDYGAVGDGTTNDGPALQLAINAASVEQRPLCFDAKTYATAQELRIPYPKHQVWKGTQFSNGNRTEIKAIAAMRAVLTAEINVWIEDVTLNANRQALCGFYAQTVSLSMFRQVSVINALRDGMLFPGENDNTHHVSEDIDLEMLRFLRGANCWVPASRRNPLTGVRCNVVSGSTTIEFTGGVDLTTLGIVLDVNAMPIIVIKSGNTIYRGHIVSITDADTLVVNNDIFDDPPPFTANDCSFSISNFTHAINDTNSFYDFSSGGNGEVWGTSAVLGEHQVPESMKTEMDTVSVEVTSGSAVVTFDGSIDLFAMKLRRGDWIRVGAGGDKRCSMIASIDTPTQLTASSNFDYSDTGLDWVIASGDGYHECPSSDNGINSFQGSSLHRSNAGCAFAFNGLYGPLMIGNQIDYQGFYGIRVGDNGTAVISPMFLRTYNESHGSDKAFYVATTLGMTVIAPIDQYGNASDNIDYAGNDNGNNWTGVYIGRDNIDPIGSGIPINLYATKLNNPSMIGLMTASGVEINSGFGSTITLTAMRVILDPGSADQTLTATPTFTTTGKAGQWVYLTVKDTQNGGIILQDDGLLANTKLRLRSNRVRLQRGESMLMFCDGTYWYEIARTRGDGLHGLASDGTIAWGSPVARAYDATATGVQPRSFIRADAETAAAASVVGFNTYYSPFAGTDITVQCSGELHIPDAVWTGGVPAATDVGKTVYLANKVATNPGYVSLTPGNIVVPLGVVQRGGSGAVMVDIRLNLPTESILLDRGDSSGTAGAATIDKLGGKSTLANGATSVVITSNKCKSTSHVLITWQEDPVKRFWVVPADGSFELFVDSDPGTDITFRWSILG